MNKREVIISREFEFAGAHRLPNYNGACQRLHGHEWKLIVYVKGYINPETHMVIDFKELKKIVDEKVINRFDHQYLNDTIEYPTAEEILFVIENLIKDEINKNENCKLYKIDIYENNKSLATLYCE